MLRIVVIALVVIAAWVLLWRIGRAVQQKRIDWTGVAFFIGFVVLAFYLHYLTGMEW